MSQAFVRESDDQWLPDLAPTIKALSVFLTHQNNGIVVYEKETLQGSDGRQLHRMSNGLSYAKDPLGKWEVIDP